MPWIYEEGTRLEDDRASHTHKSRSRPHHRHHDSHDTNHAPATPNIAQPSTAYSITSPQITTGGTHRTSDSASRGDSHPSIHSHPHASPHPYHYPSHDPYLPPYPFKSHTTPYGLNKPQWSVGPPPIVYHLSPYARVPLPPLYNLHPLLLPPHAGRPGIEWCVDKHPQFALPVPSTASGRSMGADAYHWKSLPATDPIITHPLRILLPPLHPFSPSPSSSSALSAPLIITVPPTNGVITIGDVLLAIYTSLRDTAARTMCSSMGLDPAFIAGREMQDYARLVREQEGVLGRRGGTGRREGAGWAGGVGPPAGDDGTSAHVRSLLGFRTRWAGMSASRTEAGVWVLHTRSVGGD